mgnify:CR=1 FL=1
MGVRECGCEGVWACGCEGVRVCGCDGPVCWLKVSDLLREELGHAKARCIAALQSGVDDGAVLKLIATAALLG